MHVRETHFCDKPITLSLCYNRNLVTCKKPQYYDYWVLRNVLSVVINRSDQWGVVFINVFEGFLVWLPTEKGLLFGMSMDIMVC